MKRTNIALLAGLMLVGLASCNGQGGERTVALTAADSPQALTEDYAGTLQDETSGLQFTKAKEYATGLVALDTGGTIAPLVDTPALYTLTATYIRADGLESPANDTVGLVVETKQDRDDDVYELTEVPSGTPVSIGGDYFRLRARFPLALTALDYSFGNSSKGKSQAEASYTIDDTGTFTLEAEKGAADSVYNGRENLAGDSYSDGSAVYIAAGSRINIPLQVEANVTGTLSLDAAAKDAPLTVGPDTVTISVDGKAQDYEATALGADGTVSEVALGDLALGKGRHVLSLELTAAGLVFDNFVFRVLTKSTAPFAAVTIHEAGHYTLGVADPGFDSQDVVPAVAGDSPYVSWSNTYEATPVSLAGEYSGAALGNAKFIHIPLTVQVAAPLTVRLSATYFTHSALDLAAIATVDIDGQSRLTDATAYSSYPSANPVMDWQFAALGTYALAAGTHTVNLYVYDASADVLDMDIAAVSLEANAQSSLNVNPQANIGTDFSRHANLEIIGDRLYYVAKLSYEGFFDTQSLSLYDHESGLATPDISAAYTAINPLNQTFAAYFDISGITKNGSTGYALIPHIGVDGRAYNYPATQFPGDFLNTVYISSGENPTGISIDFNGHSYTLVQRWYMLVLKVI